MTPIGELRASIPVALTVYRLNFLPVFLISVAGNLTAVFLVLILLNPVTKFLSAKSKLFNSIFAAVSRRTKRLHAEKMKRYGAPALILFVAIPLPMTGGWTGALLAFLFGISFAKAFFLVALGVVIAGIIVTWLTQLGLSIERYFGWQALLAIVIAAIIVWAAYKIIKKNNKPRKI